MESKMLSIRSFERNQILLNLINKIITHLQLKRHGIVQSEDAEELLKAKKVLVGFLTSIDEAIITSSQGHQILKGVDMRERTFIRKFIDAKRKSRQYRSILFKKSPLEVSALLQTDNTDPAELIEALTDLRNLINEHLALDLKDLVGDI